MTVSGPKYGKSRYGFLLSIIFIFIREFVNKQPCVRMRLIVYMHRYRN